MQKKGLIILLLFLFPVLLFAQGMKVKGKLVDTNGEPLIGANVTIATLSLGAASNMDGKYSFDIPSGSVNGQEVIIKASYIGFKSKTETIILKGGTLTLNFTLEEDIFKSEEVVVTGIASRTSKAVAEVAVARISAKDLTEKQSYQSVSQLVSGKIAGVNLQISSGNVGSGWRLNMRGGGGLNGNGQPLIYIDGIKVENSEIVGYSAGGQGISLLSNLNVDDIENIEVLKGPAAAAMYGTNASNGVMLITTKSGKLGTDGGKNYSINYRYNYGINTQGFTYDEHKFLQGNRMNKLLEKDGKIQEHSINISGGGKTVRYYASFQNRDERGLIPDQNHMNRTSGKLNITTYPTDNLVVKVNTGYTWNKLRRPRNDNSTYGWILNALIYNPAYSKTDSASIAAINNSTTLNQFIGGASVMYKPVKNLEMNAGAGIDYNNARNVRLYPYGYKLGSSDRGRKGIWERDSWRMTYDLNARYTYNPIKDLTATTIIGSQISETKGHSQSFYVEEFGNSIINNVSGAKEVTGRGEGKWNNKSAGIFIDNSFNYKGTYMMSLALRKDYASAVGINAPAILYPKASFAIRLDKFGFLPKEINMLKVRASYGESGQLPSTDDGIPLTWTFASYAGGLGADVKSIGNKKIEPERIKGYEFGFDAEFLKIFSLEFTHWRENAEKSIVNVFQAPSSGLGDFARPVNIGEVESYGFETMLQINPVRTAEYDLNISLIWNYQTNEVISLGNHVTDITSNQNVLKPGLSKHHFYDFKTVGAKFDKNGKYAGAIRSDKKVALGSPIPDHSGSFNINFRFLKNFNLGIFGEFGFNNRIFSYNIRRMMTTNTYRPQVELKAKLGLTKLMPEINRLTPNTAEYKAAANAYAKLYNKYYGNFIYDADYFVLREVNLSYDFSDMIKEFLPGNVVQNLVAGFSVRNLYKWSKYDFDFEVNRTGSRSSTMGADFATLPQARTYNFWFKFGF